MIDSTNRNLLVLTSSFPTSKEMGNNFVSQLCHLLSDEFSITILAPNTKGSKTKEKINNLDIVRHKVTPLGNLGLTQKSGIVSNIKRAPWLIIVTPTYIISQVLAIKKVIEEKNISVIHAHWLIPSGLSTVLYKIVFNKKVKTIVTVHGSDLHKFNFFPFGLIKKFTLKYVDTLITVSDDLKQKVNSLGYKKRVLIIPMGVDTQKFSPDKFNVELAKTCQRPILLFIGTIIKSKGIEYLIKSFEKIVKYYPSATLLIIGDGNYLDEAEVYVEILKLEENVKFLGRLPNRELPKYHATSNVFVLPSLSEGFPVVISESLSSGNICVTSNLPVFKELENYGDFIITSKVKDSEDLANKILYVLELSQEEKEKRRKSARKYAENNLSWTQITKKYKEIINENINTNQK